MTITAETVQKRLAAIRAEQSQHIANANACNGAIQQCEWLLSQLDAPEPDMNVAAPLS